MVARKFRNPREETNIRSMGVLAVHELIRRADVRGADIRVDLGTSFRPRAWPREPIAPARWLWREVHAYAWRYPDHINKLELEAVHMYFRRRFREKVAIGTRFVHLVDSQVCSGVLSKGRSGSFRLNQTLRRCSGYMLFAHAHGYFGWVRTDQNPADAPSRRWKRGVRGVIRRHVKA